MEFVLTKRLLVSAGMLTVSAWVSAGIGYYTRSWTVAATVVLMLFGAASTMMAWVHAVLVEREHRERAERERVGIKNPDSALFEPSEAALGVHRSRLSFERWGLPGFMLGAGGLLGFVAWILWGRTAGVPAILGERATVAMGFLGVMAFVLFVHGSYSAGLGRDSNQRLLRGPASYQLLAAVLFTVSFVVQLAAWLGRSDVDRAVARILVVVVGVLATETGLNLLLELYRPKGGRGRRRFLYESRLVGLLGQPGGLISSVAQAVDYQFGFQLSQTWLYRWFERSVLGLVSLQAGVIWLASVGVVIEAHEQAVVERFGRRVESRGVLEPGLHFKWPWPIDSVRLAGVRQVRGFDVGFVPAPETASERTLLWTRPHYKEEVHMLVASREHVEVAGGSEVSAEVSVPVNLLTVSIPVQYRVTNIVEWIYRAEEPHVLLERLGTREVVHYLVSVDMEELMSTGRREASEELRARLQAAAVRERLGVEILFVGLQDIHPPVQVAAAYEGVIGAIQERETRIHEAQAYGAERVPMAHAEGVRRVNEAEAHRATRVHRSKGSAGLFTNQLAAFETSPAVYRRRAFLDGLIQATSGARKYVLTTTNAHQDFWLNLEDKLRPDLLDVPLGSSGSGSGSGKP